MGILIISYNENYQASWIYRSVPLTKPGELIYGSIKALFVKFFVPIFFIFFTFCLYIWGYKIIGDFVFGFFSNALCFLIVKLLSNNSLPFSQQISTQQQSGKIAITFFTNVFNSCYSWLTFFD